MRRVIPLAIPRLIVSLGINGAKNDVRTNTPCCPFTHVRAILQRVSFVRSIARALASNDRLLRRPFDFARSLDALGSNRPIQSRAAFPPQRVCVFIAAWHAFVRTTGSSSYFSCILILSKIEHTSTSCSVRTANYYFLFNLFFKLPCFHVLVQGELLLHVWWTTSAKVSMGMLGFFCLHCPIHWGVWFEARYGELIIQSQLRI